MTFLSPRWHELRDQIAPSIGERAVLWLSFAVADAADISAASGMRAELVANGEDPDGPQVTEAEQLLIDWGRALGASLPVPDTMAARLESTFSEPLRDLVVTFARETTESAS